MRKTGISNDYILGLVEGSGTFTFSSNLAIKRRVPSFCLKMNIADKQLLEMVREKLNLKNKIYEYKNSGFNSGHAILIIRDFGQLKNIIIPFFYGKLVGSKRIQFENWINKIGKDSMVPDKYKFIYRICREGFYDNA